VVGTLFPQPARGTLIPKPGAKSGSVIKGLGKTRSGETTLVYTIGNEKSAKGISISEWEEAHRRLCAAGEFTRKWFNANMKRCSSNGPCSFTTIGGLFSLVGIAVYESPGCYLQIKASRATAPDSSNPQ
jgi:hypothetical protein